MKNESPWPTDDVERIIQSYGDMLYRLCIILLKNDCDAEDIIQETIITYCQKAPSFENREHEKAWLIRVTTNKCRDQLRFRMRHPLISDDSLDQIACDFPDSGILEALSALPEKYRIVLTLYYIEGYRTTEIARIIKRSSSAVKMRLQKGRRLLEELYRKEYL